MHDFRCNLEKCLITAWSNQVDWAWKGWRCLKYRPNFSARPTHNFADLRASIEASAVWPDLAKFCPFGKTLKVYLVFGKILNQIWLICYAMGQF